MCGIAGYSLKAGSGVDSSLLTKLFLAGLAERGEDASGFGWRAADDVVQIVKHALAPHKFLSQVDVEVPSSAREGIVHVRDHTKGRPSHHGNNHPIRHGAVTGVHNGIIQNDDELFRAHKRRRAMPGMSVDSEAIFMLLDDLHEPTLAFNELIGSYSVAFFDDRHGDSLYLARGRGRPLVLAEGPGMVLFASTRHAIRFAAQRLEIDDLDVRTVPFGTLLTLVNGEVAESKSFTVRPFSEEATASYSTSLPHAQLARKLADPLPEQGRPGLQSS